MKFERIEKLDSGTRFLIRTNLILFITLSVIMAIYYSLPEMWNLSHDTKLIYSGTTGLSIGFITVLVLRHWRNKV